ncbi:uncharacterized protein LOC131245442 [Magnolia sinica]|uniref:uncharacterized protein LOC131245442 n=1 Tax=Magnolia sinica TaxID=86752 RepID=UPI0026597395|nr:uncharacterized protein LOC131245442 [Magnolia sinica]
MEDQIARRRMNIIASHFTATNEEALSPNHIFPLNCSSSLNSIIRRRDNRTLFARQGSISQGCFMREVSIKQEFGHSSSLQEGMPLKSSGLENEKNSYELPGAPLFARPAQTDIHISHVGDHQPVKQECELSSIEPPVFARGSKGMVGQKQPSVKMIRHAACCDGFEWSPRMDIAESGRNYVVTVEIPGVSMDGIRVEVDSRNLTVTGKRSIQWWRVANVSVNSNPTYHRREILQGPYQVVWPLPDDVNKDSVSAEFVDGFLQITLPKL